MFLVQRCCRPSQVPDTGETRVRRVHESPARSRAEISFHEHNESLVSRDVPCTQSLGSNYAYLRDLKIFYLHLLYHNQSIHVFQMPKPDLLATARSTQKSTTRASQSPILAMAKPTWSRETNPLSSLQPGREQTETPSRSQSGPESQGVLGLFSQLAAKEAETGE